MTLTPEQKAQADIKRRKYDRDYKRKQRADPNYVEPPDNRTAESRREENRIRQREYRARKKLENESE